MEPNTSGPSNLQLSAIIEASHDAIIGQNLDGIVLSWNGGAEKMFGYSKKEIIGKSILTIIPSELQSESQVILGKVKKGEVVADYDTVRLRKDGSKINVALSIAPVISDDGSIIGLSAVERDIAERKKNEQRIKDLNEVRNKFIEIISHQLRTPLTVINWNLESLLKGDFGKLEPTQDKFLQVTHKASTTLASRMHELLTAMDIEEGRVMFTKEKFALDSIVAAVMNEGACKLKNISCVYTPPVGDFPTIEGDSEKIKLVVTKLIENAVAYTKEGGQVSVKLFKIADGVHFEITDTGIGIPKPEQKEYFYPFFPGIKRLGYINRCIRSRAFYR